MIVLLIVRARGSRRQPRVKLSERMSLRSWRKSTLIVVHLLIGNSIGRERRLLERDTVRWEGRLLEGSTIRRERWSYHSRTHSRHPLHSWHSWHSWHPLHPLHPLHSLHPLHPLHWHTRHHTGLPVRCSRSRHDIHIWRGRIHVWTVSQQTESWKAGKRRCLQGRGVIPPGTVGWSKLSLT